MLFLLILPQSGQGNWGRERWNDYTYGHNTNQAAAAPEPEITSD